MSGRHAAPKLRLLARRRERRRRAVMQELELDAFRRTKEHAEYVALHGEEAARGVGRWSGPATRKVNGTAKTG